MPGSTTRRKRSRGSIEELPSGSLRVSVYAGIDPVTKRRHYLREIIPAGQKAGAEAEKAMRRLAGQVDERRWLRTNLDAIVGALGEADFVELGSASMVVHRRRGDGSES